MGRTLHGWRGFLYVPVKLYLYRFSLGGEFCFCDYSNDELRALTLG